MNRRGTTRLVELFDPALVSDRPDEVAEVERTEWRFDAAALSGASKMGPWHAAVGIENLRVEDGRLKGRTSDPVPVMWGERVARGGRRSSCTRSRSACA
jgi:hypothetical protein